jgi:hypothetical protein
MPEMAQPGQRRIDHLAGYREVGVARVMTLVQASADSAEALASLAADARAAGIDLA